jgi:hypothetical protein
LFSQNYFIWLSLFSLHNSISPQLVLMLLTLRDNEDKHLVPVMSCLRACIDHTLHNTTRASFHWRSIDRSVAVAKQSRGKMVEARAI